MKLQIFHQNHGIEGQMMINESETDDHLEETQMNISPDHKFAKENSPNLEDYKISGKRKRKPREMIDDFTPILVRKKKNQSAYEAKDGTLDSALKSPTLIQAEEFQRSLCPDNPSFIKVLVRSHVASCFWMGIPASFCKLYLPIEDTTVVVEDENCEKFEVKYIANKTGLSAGWRKFVVANRVLEGDVLIFQLIGPCRFKVYIVRVNDLSEVDVALSLLILESKTNQKETEGTIDAPIKKKRRPKSLPVTVVVQKKKQKEGPLMERSGNDSEEVASEVLEGSASNFQQVKTFEEFHIMANGVCIDSELPLQIRRKYYDLCCSKNAFLHEGLIPGLNSKLCAGTIAEAVNISDAIRGCTLETPREEFEVWEKSLMAFELLGLNVGFLRARLVRLINLLFDSKDAFEARRYWGAKREKSRFEDEIQNLEVKLWELKESYAKCDHDVENSKVKAERYEVKFREEASASW